MTKAVFETKTYKADKDKLENAANLAVQFGKQGISCTVGGQVREAHAVELDALGKELLTALTELGYGS